MNRSVRRNRIVRKRKVAPRRRVVTNPQRYRVRNNMLGAPLAISRTNRSKAPKITRTRYGMCSITHREKILDVAGSVAFSNVQVPINPGMQSAFPWLSQEAVGWEEYRFRKLEFEYITNKSANTSGKLIMAPDYDASDSVPITTTQIENYYNSVSDVVWQNFNCNIENRAYFHMGENRFIRFGALSSNQDIKFYDIANINFAIFGCADTTTHGEIYASYTVDFFIPQVPDPGSISQSVTLFDTTANDVTIAALAGLNPTINPGRVGLSVAANVLTFTNLQPGSEYHMSYDLDGTGITTPITAVGSAGLASKAGGEAIINAAATAMVGLFTLAASSTSGVVTLASTTVITTSTSLRIVFSQIKTSGF